MNDYYKFAPLGAAHIKALQICAKNLSDSYGRVMYIGYSDPSLTYVDHRGKTRHNDIHMMNTKWVQMKISYIKTVAQGFVVKKVCIGQVMQHSLKHKVNMTKDTEFMNDILPHLNAIQADLPCTKSATKRVDYCYVIHDSDRDQILDLINNEIASINKTIQLEAAAD